VGQGRYMEDLIGKVVIADRALGLGDESSDEGE
jgi:hypothetical protein